MDGLAVVWADAAQMLGQARQTLIALPWPAALAIILVPTAISLLFRDLFSALASLALAMLALGSVQTDTPGQTVLALASLLGAVGFAVRAHQTRHRRRFERDTVEAIAEIRYEMREFLGALDRRAGIIDQMMLDARVPARQPTPQKAAPPPQPAMRVDGMAHAASGAAMPTAAASPVMP